VAGARGSCATGRNPTATRCRPQPQRHVCWNTRCCEAKSRPLDEGPRPVAGPGDPGYPDSPVVLTDEALRTRNKCRLPALGIAMRPRSGMPGRAYGRGPDRRTSRRRWRQGTWRVDPSLLGQPFSGRAGLRSPLALDRRPQAHGSSSSITTIGWRCTSPLPNVVGVLRATDPVRRPTGGKARRHRRPQDRSAPGRRDPPRRGLQQDRDSRRESRDQGSGPLAQTRISRCPTDLELLPTQVDNVSARIRSSVCWPIRLMAGLLSA